MTVYDIIFYLFAAVTLISGFFVVTNRNIVHSAFFLLFTFLNSLNFTSIKGVSNLYS